MYINITTNLKCDTAWLTYVTQKLKTRGLYLLRLQQ